MKNLLLLCLLLGAAPVWAQTADDDGVYTSPKSGTGFVRYTDVSYTVATETTAPTTLADTVAPASGLALRKEEQVFITSYPCPNWAQATKGGQTFYVRTSWLKPYRKALRGRKPAPILSQQVQNAPYIPGDHNVQVGPRGGHYYINSNGNKTYIKR